MKDSIEIERKFLVRESELPELPPGDEIAQAYLGLDPVVRVRVQGGSGVLTVKGRGLRARREIEVEIGADAAAALLELRVAGTAVVRKTRHRLPWGGRVWEIDRFAPPWDGLLLAEVELSTAAEAVELPPWVGEEVTDDPAYQNANLARSCGPDESREKR